LTGKPPTTHTPAPTTLRDRITQIKERIAAACAKAKRDPSEITLVTVSKYAAPELIRESLAFGLTDLGENRVPQLVQRAAQINEYHTRRLASDGEGFGKKLRWHMVGHLQRNKVKQLLPAVSLIHSVDSLRLAEEIDTQAGRLEKKISILLQVNASEESQKSGIAVGAVVALAEQIDTMENIQIAGLMTMAQHGAAESDIRHTFSRVREIYDEMKFQKIGKQHLRHLSMGMTDDFEMAILEGATIVRIGSAIFGGLSDAAEQPEED